MELWLVPNLNNEKLGIFDSFKPLYSLKKKRKKEGKKIKGSDQENSDQEDQGRSQDGEEEQEQEEKTGQDQGVTEQAPPPGKH